MLQQLEELEDKIQEYYTVSKDSLSFGCLESFGCSLLIYA